MPTRTNSIRRCFTTIVVLWLGSSAGSAESSEILFSRDVLPILSENCFFCHGPDEEQRQGGLRLDTEDGAGESLNHTSLAESELLKRILSDDPDEIMPPPESNRSLSKSQKDTVRQWVLQGAPWGKHWSFEPLTTPAVPVRSFSEFPTHNPVDAFVQRKLLAKKLTPSIEAPRHTLIRRLSLDLTGLPPTAEAVSAFLEDTSPEAYEKLVDQFLISPAYGERMAWDWLDAARYADTNGYQGDRERTMWPWRDWVVTAFNNNMPFDQFTTQQLAGDLLPNATVEQKLATGFCRNHMINGEGGRIAEENRVDYVMDMSETMGTVWLGLTLNCCRCHDHKYDPLTQDDYYQFFAFFNQTPVKGNGGDPQTKPNLAVPTLEQEKRLARIDEQLRDIGTRLTAKTKELLPKQVFWERAMVESGHSDGWKVLAPTKATAQHMTLTARGDRSVLVGGENSVNDTYTVRYALPTGTIGAIRLEALRHPSMTNGGLARSDSGNFVLTEIECAIVRSSERKLLEIESAIATFEQGALKIQGTFDGNRNTGWAVYEGRPIDRDHAAVFRFSNTMETKAGDNLEVVLRHDSPHKFHNLGRFRIASTKNAKAELASDNSQLLTELKTPAEKRNAEQAKRIRDAFLQSDTNYQKLTTQRGGLNKTRADVLKSVPKVMVMEDLPEWRTTFVLNRGLYNDVTEREVKAVTPQSLPAMKPNEERGNRLDLARWLVSKDQPLTARVTVNRFWQQLFGIGLVKTIEDFGVQAEYPEHKDLLDWLAADFRDNGWDVKRLLKTILMSHTYRQSSVSRMSKQLDATGQPLSLAEIDPENRLLARAPRFRLPSWMLRDNALAVSGLLNASIGGPPVNTYQPAGVWEEATFGKKTYKQDTGESLYRRSLYIFWRRIIAPTMFFDNASRQACTVKSMRTNTPLHALLTFNETTYVEAARNFAQQLLKDVSLRDDQARLNHAFLAVVARPPTQPEVQVMLGGISRNKTEYTATPDAARELLTVGESKADSSLDAAKHAAWTAACLALLNLDEALNRE